MEAQAERRLAAIMFTDVVGYTTLAQANEAEAMKRLEEHRAILRGIFPLYNGKEVKTIGDAFLIEFPSALQAVTCSIEIQRQMRDRNAGLSDEKQVQIRVGVHVGDVIHAQGDILGDAVNVSSRIEPLAPAGGVCISEQVYDHVRNKIDNPLERIEGKTLKNVKLPIEVYRIIMPWEAETKADVGLDTKRVAVLPLKNMSPDPNDEYFADGMTEELITALASVTELTVIARTSVMQYKNGPKRISDIGRELNAGTLVEGSVRKAANKVRITVQLIDARNEGHLWAQSYDKQLDDIFTIQSEVAQKVAEALKVKLVEEDVQRLERGSTKNTEAYTLYLKGMFYWNKRTHEALTKAAELLKEAVRLDPSFALGHAGLAQCYQVMAANYIEDPLKYFPKAKESALMALSLDGRLVEAHTVLAAVYGSYDRDIPRSLAQFEKAIQINPNYATAHQWYSQLLTWVGRTEEANREIQRALGFSPLSMIIGANIINSYFYAKEYDKGIEYGKKLIEMDPNFEYTYLGMIECYLGKSMFTEAMEAVDTVSKLITPNEAKLARAWVYSRMKRVDECHTLLSEIEPVAEKEHISPTQIAYMHFALGENDKGFEWLEKAFAAFDRYAYDIAVEQVLDGVRSDPRYLSMLERLGLAQYWKPK
ncbi:MAG: hypothetical protein HY296_04975 [Thaumarchaeota archaeon]|nr:hypothetical protein [Nitrososphaerota archaeon]